MVTSRGFAQLMACLIASEDNLLLFERKSCKANDKYWISYDRPILYLFAKGWEGELSSFLSFSLYARLCVFMCVSFTSCSCPLRHEILNNKFDAPAWLDCYLISRILVYARWNIELRTAACNRISWDRNAHRIFNAYCSLFSLSLFTRTIC